MSTSHDKHRRIHNNRNIILTILITLVLPISAAQGSCQQKGHSAGASADTAQAKTDTAQAKAELHSHLEHYWDGVQPDTLSAEALEQRLVDYVFLCTHADKEQRHACWQRIAQLLPEQQPNRMVTEYLGEPDSPLYSPEMLEEYLAATAELFAPGSLERVRVDYLLTGVRKNKPGAKIADLELTTASGGRTTLHRLIAESGRASKVLFYDPECEECEALISRLAAEAGADGVIAVSVTGSAKPLPPDWQSCIAADEEQLDENFHLPRLPQLYSVSAEGIIAR